MNNLEEFTNPNAEVMAVKKNAILLICCLCVIAVCAVFSLNPGIFLKKGRIVSTSSEKSMSSYSTSKATSSQENTSAAQTLASESETYVVREYNGHIGVFRDSETTPFREFQTDVSVLPKDDQLALQKGKVLHSMADVERLMEDYDS